MIISILSARDVSVNHSIDYARSCIIEDHGKEPNIKIFDIKNDSDIEESLKELNSIESDTILVSNPESLDHSKNQNIKSGIERFIDYFENNKNKLYIIHVLHSTDNNLAYSYIPEASVKSNYIYKSTYVVKLRKIINIGGDTVIEVSLIKGSDIHPNWSDIPKKDHNGKNIFKNTITKLLNLKDSDFIKPLPTV